MTGASLTPVIDTVKVALVVKVPSVTVMVKVSEVLVPRALTTVSSGVYV